jgi:L-asparagine transporter-like permease
VLVTSIVALALAVSGTFAAMAAASAITRLIVYVATCAATLRLRSPACRAAAAPASFVVPFGPVIPVTAIIVSFSRSLASGAAALTR